MRRLATLRHPDTPTSGSELHRLAVRALVRRAGRLLLVESADGDLALPGGGVEPGESPEDALRRVAGSTWRRSPRDLVVLEHLVAEGP